MTRRPRLLPAALLCAAAAATAVASGTAPAAAGGRPPSSVSLVPVGTFTSALDTTGVEDGVRAEIPAYDPRTSRVFVTSSVGVTEVLDVRDPSAPVKVGELATPGANSVAVRDGLVAVASQAADRTEPGRVAFFDSTTLLPLGEVVVGALPDMLTFTPDGSALVVAGEGEPSGYLAGDVDPVGTVAVIAVPEGGAPDQQDVRIAGFEAWDGREGELRAAGVRVFGPGATAAQDLEPEYVAVDRTSRTAWVTLQENNALAVVDLRTATVTDVVPLGLKDHSRPGNALDASDRDGAIALRSWPALGMYQPDAVGAFAHRGDTYLLAANEGDAREYDGFAEEARAGSLLLSPDAFPDAPALQRAAALGRLNVTTTSPRDGSGRYTALHSFGARSVSVRDASGRLVWDSGDELERLVARENPAFFNAGNDDVTRDSRSDNKGPEPEGLVIGAVAGRDHAFVGLERVGGVVVYDLSDPAAPRLVDYVTTRDFSSAVSGDSGPEGLAWVPGEDSPTGRPLLVVSYETSGTTTLFEVTGR